MLKRMLQVLAVILPILLLGGFFIYSQRKPEPVVVQSAPVEPKPQPGCLVPDTEIVSAINKVRGENGVKPVSQYEMLEKLANDRAQEQNGVLDDHSGFQKYKTANSYLWSRYRAVGEDLQLLRVCGTAEERIRSFRTSPAHWQSILNPNFDEVGVEYYKDILVVEMGDLK